MLGRDAPAICGASWDEGAARLEGRTSDSHRGDDMPEASAGRTRSEHANPILAVANLARSVRYYVDVLGFTNAE
jgi:hypothetical protein